MSNRIECHIRYGRENFQEFKDRLIGGQKNKVDRKNFLVWDGYFGRFQSLVGGDKKVKPTATIREYNNRNNNRSSARSSQKNSWKMKGRDLEDHLLAAPGEVDRMIVYCTQCPVIGDKRVGLFKFDIDNHSHRPMKHVYECRDLVESVFGYSSIYWEPSTMGSGLHGYLMICWYRYNTNSHIKEDILRLQHLIGRICGQLPAQCKEIRGQPPLTRDGMIIQSGGASWAKVPRPQTSSQMEDFLTATNVKSPCWLLIQQAEEYLGAQRMWNKDDGSHSSWQKNTAPSASSSSPSSLVKAPLLLDTEGVDTNVWECTSRENAIPAHELGVEEDTFKRATQFTSHYFRIFYNQRQGLPSLEKTTDAYIKAGLNIGNSDERCLRDAHKFHSRTFDPKKTRTSAESYMPQATQIIRKCIDENGLLADLRHDQAMRKRVYKAKGFTPNTIRNLNRIKEEELTQVYACMLYELEKRTNKTGTWGKKQCKKMLKFFGTKMDDDKKFKAVMRWIRRNKLAQIVEYQIPDYSGRGGGQSRIYKLAGNVTAV